MSVHIALNKSKKRVKELEQELNLVQRQLWALRSAVVGTWKEAVRCGSPWHKELRGPMVDLGYLQHEGWEYSINPEWDALAMEWLRDKYSYWYGDGAEEMWRIDWGDEE
tara:strand:- start:1135 stop:1461 length:327 start_codon:yes stop_codon:yes gene_type:complete